MMKIIKSILSNSSCYAAGRKIKVKGLMLHSVGCPQPDARTFVQNWNKPMNSCVHAFIDGLTGDVYQTLPWEHRGWHCGGEANNTHIGVEMCEPDCIKYSSGSNFTCSNYSRANEIVRRTYDSAVELFAQLCKQYNLNPMTDIISHYEGSKRGVASSHGDPDHLWSGLNTGYTMNGFRMAVQARLTSGCIFVPSDNKNTAETKFEPYTAIITADVLNVRSQPGTNYPITTKVYKGEAYTIVDTDASGKWGKLKSGAGWICLDYTRKL